MSLLDTELAGRQWLRVGDTYEVTRKPRGLDVSSLPEIPFASMAAIPEGGAYHSAFTMKTPDGIKSGTYFERGDILVAKITPSFENGKQALTTALPTSFGYATTEVIPLRPRMQANDPRLLFFYLLHPDIRHHIAERMEGTDWTPACAGGSISGTALSCFRTGRAIYDFRGTGTGPAVDCN